MKKQLDSFTRIQATRSTNAWNVSQRRLTTISKYCRKHGACVHSSNGYCYEKAGIVDNATFEKTTGGSKVYCLQISTSNPS